MARQQCTATAKSSGRQCAQPAVPGAVVCRVHGGSAPQVKAAAQRRVEAAQQERLALAFGAPRDVEPGMAILEEIHRTAGLVDWYAARILDLDPDSDPRVLSWGRVSESSKQAGAFPGTDTTWSAAPPVLLELWMRERKHLVEVCAAALKAGVEERRVRLAESQGALVAAAIRRILEALDLSGAQWDLVGTVVPRELRAIEVTA